MGYMSFLGFYVGGMKGTPVCNTSLSPTIILSFCTHRVITQIKENNIDVILSKHGFFQNIDFLVGAILS